MYMEIWQVIAVIAFSFLAGYWFRQWEKGEV